MAPVRWLRVAWLALALAQAAAPCPICAACECKGNDVFCASRVLLEPLSLCERTRMLYVLDSAMSSAFLDALDAALLQKLHVVASNVAGVRECSLARLPELTLLEMSGAGLQKLPARAFANNSKLEVVALAANHLAELPAGLFSPLPRLAVAHLHGNRLRRLRAGAFWANERLHTLDVSNNSLASIEPRALNMRAAPGGDASLDASHNALREVRAGTFSACSRLAALDLSHNRLSLLWPSSFAGLRRLRDLSLRANALDDLPPGLFLPLGALQRLDLSWNALRRVEADAFAGATALERLQLSANKIERLHARAFAGLPALRELLLDDNALHHLGDAFRAPLPALRLLDASRNLLEDVPRRAFAGCPQLRALRLGDNALRAVAACAFAPNFRLRELRLRRAGGAAAALGGAQLANLSALQELCVEGAPVAALRRRDVEPLRGLRRLALRVDARSRCECSAFALLRAQGVHVELQGVEENRGCALLLQRLYDDADPLADCPRLPLEDADDEKCRMVGRVEEARRAAASEDDEGAHGSIFIFESAAFVCLLALLVVAYRSKLSR